jgi:LEA14-like dessication related protein
MLATALAACATLSQLRFEKPTLELTAVEVNGLDLNGVSLTLWLDVFNPNDYDIPTTRVEADLDLENTPFGYALLEESVVLASAAHTRVAIPARFSWEGIGAGARALLDRGQVAYRLESRLQVQTRMGGRTLSFQNRGEVPIR